MLRMNICGSSTNVDHETAVSETVRKHFSMNGVYKLADLITAQAKETCDRIEEGDITLTFTRSAWICGYGVATLDDYDWKGKKLIIKEERGEDMVSVYLQLLVLGRQRKIRLVL